MKTITLKLTKQEDDRLYSLMVRTDLLKKILYFDGKCNVEIKDADKFREFLKDEIGLIDYMSKTGNKNASWKQITINDKILKSILSKLDKAVDKPEEGKIYALTGGVGVKCIANGDSWKDSVVQNDEPKSYSQKVNEEIECIKFEQKQYHGDLDILKEGFIDSDEAEWDGLGITYESVRQCSCSHCGKSVSELELRLFRKHSNVDEDLCKDCHSKSTANLSMKEMAKLVMEYLPCHTDGDLLWTLENQFKRRSDLAYMLMVVSKAKYEVRSDI